MEDGRYPVISCPYHRWGYALDGRLLATPLVDTTKNGKANSKKKGRPAKSKAGGGGKGDAAASTTAATAVTSPCEQSVSIADVFSTDHLKSFDKKDFSLFDVRVDTFGG